MLAVLTMLAQGGEAPARPPAGFDIGVFLLIGVAFLFFIVLPMRRDRRARQEMMAAVDKGARVVIQNAIVGVVDRIVKAEAKEFEDELYVRVDDNANVKLRVLRSSITRVLPNPKKDSKDGA